MSDSQFNDLDWFRKIRNKAAHEAIFTLNTEDLESFKGTKFGSIDKFGTLCVDLFMELWNKHLELFGPKFGKSMADEAIKRSTEENDYLSFTHKMMTECHLVANIELRIARTAYVRCVYERSPQGEKLIESEGSTYVRKGRRAWIKSAAGKKVGAVINANKSDALDLFVESVSAPIQPSLHKDQAQGDTVWKPIRETNEDGNDLIVFEKTREKPKPDGVYPKYTFVKYSANGNNELLLAIFSAQMLYGEKVVPITIRYSYLLSFPPGTTIMAKGEIEERRKGKRH